MYKKKLCLYFWDNFIQKIGIQNTIYVNNTCCEMFLHEIISNRYALSFLLVDLNNAIF